jgi:redox-sensitive bicupin YhaK (pirin superfamily)
MIRVIKSEERYHLDAGWLDARWHFSFGDYYDPKNLHFSSLRVFNDDWIKGGGGFDLHPHKDMEIVTIMLEGDLRHKDILGNNALLQTNEIQVMSAGSGISHAEFNDSATKPAHLMQIWFLPRNKGSTPRYEQKAFDPSDRQGRMQALVSDGSVDGTLAIDQDVTVLRGDFKAGQGVKHDASGRSVYVFVIEGAGTLNGQPLSKGDQARITDESDLDFQATADAQLLVIDLS